MYAKVSPNPNKEAAESSALRRSTVIRLRILERRSTRLTPPAPVPNVDKADEMILQDTLQISLAEHKSREEQEARENVALIDEHLASEEIEKMVDGQENVVDDSSIPRNDESNIPGTRIEPRSNKESLEVEITKDKEVEITKETPLVDITNVERGNIQAKFRHKLRMQLPMSFLLKLMHPYEDDLIDDAHPEGRIVQADRRNRSNQQQDDDFDFWTDSYALDDDEIPTKQAPALSLINQDLLYLKKGNSGPEKIVLSLHKFLAVIFNDDDIEERTSRWVNKCVRKFNPYARYGVEHWKNPHAKIFYIRKQKEPGKPKEEVYSNSKIIQVVKTYWELGHEHKFITEIVARRANKYLVSITEPDYKNLNKNDIEDIYLLIMNGKVPDYADTGLLWSLSVFIRSTVIWERVHDFQLGIESYQQKVNLTAPTMTFPGIEDHEMFSIIYELVHGIIYKNSKKEKRVMRHLEIHKFCDATLNRVLEEETEDRLKHRRQMRRWEMFVNGRPLGPRRERPE
ncbi:hypothetical protein Tco_1057635 [Tanacetum coccineum]|uniref:Uncharacterized protein n=1 Tax=Tanacetum coccineum TaxID=301880 RepID=A0ABQ5H6I6_9ASTR